ncbi:MAG: hypothetical protein ABII27_00050 [bacterium]
MNKDEICPFGWLFENGIIPLVSTFLGAYFAYKFSIRQSKKNDKAEVVAYLSLIKGDIEKTKSLLESLLVWKWGEPIYIAFVPTTYYGKLNEVKLRTYVSPECVEHIRNIYENVFSKWNNSVNEFIKQPVVKRNEYFRDNMVPLIDQEHGKFVQSACETVVKAIDKELKA